jgi:hypothetical protein
LADVYTHFAGSVNPGFIAETTKSQNSSFRINQVVPMEILLQVITVDRVYSFDEVFEYLKGWFFFRMYTSRPGAEWYVWKSDVIRHLLYRSLGDNAKGISLW